MKPEGNYYEVRRSLHLMLLLECGSMMNHRPRSNIKELITDFFQSLKRYDLSL